MKKRLIATVLAVATTAAAWAHNGMEHVMGTVAAITATSVQVKSTAGKLTTVLLNDKTMWMKGKEMAHAADLHVGDRVVIHAAHKDGKLVAAEVDTGAATAAAHSH